MGITISNGRRMSAVALMALAALGSGTMSGGQQALAPRVTVSSKKKRRLWTGDAIGSSDVLNGRRGAGICMAVQQRAAKKKRNVKRHKAHCRG